MPVNLKVPSPSPYWEDSQLWELNTFPSPVSTRNPNSLSPGLLHQPISLLLFLLSIFLACWLNELTGCTSWTDTQFLLPQIFPVFLSCIQICTSYQPVPEGSVSPTHTVGSRSAPLQCHSFLKCAFSAIATHVVITCSERQKEGVINQSLLQQNSSKLLRHKTVWIYRQCNLNLKLRYLTFWFEN